MTVYPVTKWAKKTEEEQVDELKPVLLLLDKNLYVNIGFLFVSFLFFTCAESFSLCTE